MPKLLDQGEALLRLHTTERHVKAIPNIVADAKMNR